MTWSVYIISCSDGSFYTGISTDVVRRFGQHLQGKGAKYFRSRQPTSIVFIESGHCRGTATQREMAIKKMNRSDKLRLIAANRSANASPIDLTRHHPND